MQKSEVEQQTHQIKRDTFRLTIRNKQLQQHFEQKRKSYMLWQYKQQQLQIKKCIEQYQLKQEWLYQKYIQLDQVEGNCLFGILKQLSLGLQNIGTELEEILKKMEEINYFLLKKVVGFFKKENLSSGLCRIAACVLEEIFFLCSGELITTNIVTKEFVGDLVGLCGHLSRDIDGREEDEVFFGLINTILGRNNSFRSIFISQGIVQVLVTKLEKHQNKIQSDQVYLSFSIIYQLVKPHKTQSSSIYSTKCQPSISIKTNELQNLIPIICLYLHKITTIQLLKLVLKIVSALTKQPKISDIIIQTLCQKQQLIERLLQLLENHPQPIIRSASSNIITNITSTHIPTLLSSHNLLPILTRSILPHPHSYNLNHAQFTHNILKILSNVVLNTLLDAKTVFFHPIFEQFIIPCARNLDNKGLHSDGLFIIGSLVMYKDFDIVETLVRKFRVFQIFALGIRSQVLIVDDFLQIIRSLSQIVQIYRYNSEEKQHKIIKQLQSLYNIPEIFQQVQEKLKNKTVQLEVSNFLQIMYGN